MTRLRSIGFEINRRYEIISLFPVSIATGFSFQFGDVVANAVLLGGCLAAYLGGRLLNKAAEQWARDEFREMGIDFDAFGN